MFFLIKNFEQENYDVIIICGIIRNQDQLDSFDIKFGRFLEIDTSDKTPEEVAEIIKREIA